MKGNRRLASIRPIGNAWEARVYEGGGGPPILVCGPRDFVERTMVELVSGDFATGERGSGTWRREDQALSAVLDDNGSTGGEIHGRTPKRID